MPDVSNRRIHFFDVKAIYYDASDRHKFHAADVDPLFAKLQQLRYQRGGADSSIVSIWGNELVGAVDLPSTDFVAGRFSKVRTTGLPGIVSSAGYRRVKLGLGEGLYEASHFVYFRKAKILAMEYNMHAPQAKMFGIYLDKLAHTHNLQIDKIELPVKVDPDTIKRLLELGTLTTVEASVYASQAGSLRHAGRLANALRAVAGTVDTNFKAAVRLTQERPGKLRIRSFGQELKQQVIEIWTESGDVLTSLKVYAEPPGGGPAVPIDFKNDRFSVSLPVAMNDGSVDTGDVYAQIIKYYNDSQMGETVR